MKDIKEYYLNKIKETASCKGYETYIKFDFSNTGWMFFINEEEGTRKKLYFNFQNNHGDIRKGNGNIFEGVYFEYMTKTEENKLFKFIENYLQKGA